MGAHSKSETNKDRPSGTYLLTLYAVSIICGSILMSFEIIGGRLLSPFFGSSVYVWGSVITVFMTALSAGYYVGGIAADRKPSLAWLAGFIAAAGLLILAVPPLVTPFVHFSFSAGMGNYGALVVSVLLFFLPSLGLGMVSPYIVKLGLRETSRVGNMVGKFYAVSTFGSILGTLATTFVLIPLIGVKEIIFSLGLALVALALIVLISVRRIVPFVIFLILAGAIYTPAFTYTNNVIDGLQNGVPVFHKETVYNNILVADYGTRRYMLFNNSEQSVMDRNNPDAHLWLYTKVMDKAAEYYMPEAKDILLIGVGGGTIPKAVISRSPETKIDAVDIDPEVLRAAVEYFDMPNDPRIIPIAADGRMFLRGKKAKYDVIMVDAYNRTSIPFHLTTREFFKEVETALKPGGVVIFNVVSSIEGDYGQFFKSLLKTSGQVFPEYRLFQTETNDPEELANLILVVSKSKLASPGELSGGREYVNHVDVSKSVVLTDNYAPVDTLAVKIMTKT